MASISRTPLPARQLGAGGPLVSCIGLGCMGMSEFYGARNDEQSIRVVHRAIDLGCTFLDTADMYGVGHNEQLLAIALKGKRDQVFLATKFGNVRGKDGAFLGVNGKADYVQSACEASLKRLNVETIDLYYQHRVDDKTPIEDTVAAMGKLVAQGKVRYLGMSESCCATLRRAVKIHPIAALQTEYSLFSREPEAEIIPTCRELGVGFVPYSPLGRGFLTGAFTKPDEMSSPGDNRGNFPRFQGENFDRNFQLVKEIQRLAAARHITPAQLALAWVLAQGQDMIPIPGTRQVKYLEENLAAAAVKLSPADLAQLDSALPVGAAAGDRYHPNGMKTLNR